MEACFANMPYIPVYTFDLARFQTRAGIANRCLYDQTKKQLTFVNNRKNAYY